MAPIVAMPAAKTAPANAVTVNRGVPPSPRRIRRQTDPNHQNSAITARPPVKAAHRISSPLSSTTPAARPPSSSTRATRAPVRTVAPCSRAALPIASATAPIPPSWKPQLPRWPSPMSPMEWCAMT